MFEQVWTAVKLIVRISTNPNIPPACFVPFSCSAKLPIGLVATSIQKKCKKWHQMCVEITKCKQMYFVYSAAELARNRWNRYFVI